MPNAERNKPIYLEDLQISRIFLSQPAVAMWLSGMIVDHALVPGVSYGDLQVVGHYQVALQDRLERRRPGYVCCFQLSDKLFLFLPYFDNPTNPRMGYQVEGVHLFAANSFDYNPNNRVLNLHGEHQILTGHSVTILSSPSVT